MHIIISDHIYLALFTLYCLHKAGREQRFPIAIACLLI